MSTPFAPRALLRRSLIPVELMTSELSTLIGALEAKAMRVAQEPDLIDAADILFLGTAGLREAFR